jgi:hypothetical protein
MSLLRGGTKLGDLGTVALAYNIKKAIQKAEDILLYVNLVPGTDALLS